MKSALLISLLAIGAGAQADGPKESKDFSGEGITQLVIKNGQGDIDVDPSTDGRIWVVTEKGNFPKGCELEMNTKGSTFEIIVKGEGEKSGWLSFGSKSCEVDFDIRVPQTVAVDIMSGSGDVEVGGLMGSAKVQTGSGDVSIKYTQAVEQGEVTIKTGSGDAELEFPAGMKIQTAFRAGSGKITKNEFSETADAKFKVSMEAGSGDLEIKTLR